MRIAIFGSSGFLGKNLVRSFQKTDEVTEISLRNSFWRNDIAAKTDVFINLIGKAHDHEGTAKVKDYYTVNVELTQQLFATFKKSEAKLFIHISSLAAVEEFESLNPLTETDDCSPASHYGKSKRDAEIWLLKEELAKDKKLIIIRPPMVHGSGDKGNLGLLYKMIWRGIPYPLAAFNNERSFISINNFIFYIEQIIKNQDKLKSDIYHISDKEFVSTKKIVKIIEESLEKKVINIPVPQFLIKKLARIGDFFPLPLNTIRLKKMTSYLLVSNNKINSLLEIDTLAESAEAGLKKTIESFKSR